MAAGTVGKGQIVNRSGLADVFGIALNTIDAWVRNGCPVVQKGGGRGQEWKFNTAEVGKWLRASAAAEAKGTKDASIEELNRRKAQASTELVELELAKAKGEVAPIADFERTTSMLMGAIRQNVMSVPQRAVLRLLGETDEAAFKQVLREELTLALETAANEDLEPEDDLDDDDTGG